MSERGHLANPTFTWWGGHLECELGAWKKLGARGGRGGFCEGCNVAGWGQPQDNLGKVGSERLWRCGVKVGGGGGRGNESNRERRWLQRRARRPHGVQVPASEAREVLRTCWACPFALTICQVQLSGQWVRGQNILGTWAGVHPPGCFFSC